MPHRRCIGCGTIRPKAELLRLVAAGSQVACDPGAVMPGRGAYVCGPACAERAVKRRAVSRALRRTVEIPPDFVESIALHGEKAHS